MLSLRQLMDVVCTEAIVYGGLQEVPDRVDGAVEHYHSAKRNARGQYGGREHDLSGELPPIHFDLELIEGDDGTLRWEE